MYTKEQLEGILLSQAKCEINVSKDITASIGYRVRLRINFRGEKDYLIAIARSLNQNSVYSKFKEKEHQARPRPILTVTGKTDLWETFKEAREIVHDLKGHQTSDGLDRILELKGLI